MRSRLLAATGAVVLALSGGLVASGSPAAADDAHCYNYTTHPDVIHSGDWRFGDGTAIRRGPFTDCDILGRGYPTQGIDVHCHVYNTNGVLWVYVRDTSTGVAGWARGDTIFGGTQTGSCY